ncbi:MAG: HAD-IC family P-type ATPase, partial [Candidatus Aegiribacteria sp.]|nr:HAD-IC family P-type ATPase [Candidatus Aegiribacteria sp.]MBD3294740.1 HAD-IC family P-type ATPase [Candidatus Fermentibacteria bacterium]
PETVLHKCSSLGVPGRERQMTEDLRNLWLERNRSMASQGLRILAVAEKTTDDKEEEPYRRLRFLGLVGFMDPPRDDVKPALDKCRHGGVRVVMVTGDQPLTAEKVAWEVGLIRKETSSVWLGSKLKSPGEMEEEELTRLLETSIFSRVSPEQKLNIVDAHQENGEVVAMTGDGVNDAPALKKADIGVTMGRRGTQVAREASDMVIKDDAFSSIVAAVEQGRIIFENIRKFVIYLLSCNVSEIMTVSLATLAGGPLPLLPLQILFLNLVTDVFPALALGVGKGDTRIMDRPPRDPSEPVVTKSHWWLIAGYSGLITAAVLGALAAAILLLDFSGERAVTVSFLTLAFAQLWHVFNMRKPASPPLSNEITRNIYIWGALALCVLLLLAAVYFRGLSRVLSLSPPGASGWLLIISASLVPLLAGQLILHLRKK